MKSLAFLWLIFVLCGCLPKAKVSVSRGNVSDPTIDPNIVYSGIDSTSDKTDSTIVLNWPTHADAVSYEIYSVASKRSSLLISVSGQSSNTTTLTGLTPSGSYKFRIRVKNLSGLTDGNVNDLSVTMNAAPDVPTSLSLITPSVTPGYTDTPTIRVSGVKNGDVVKLFSDATCTTQVSSGTATGASVDLTTSTMSVGAYDFYANATNVNSTSSVCSTQKVSYTRQSCPAGSTPYNEVCYVSFSGITSYANKTDSTIELTWPAHADATSYEIYNTLPATPVLVKTVSGQASTSTTLTNLTPSTDYKWRVKVRTSLGLTDRNTNDLSVTMNAAPDVPNGLTLILPTVSSAITVKPKIRVSGVKSGDLIKLFTDSSCTSFVGSATSAGTTVDITTNPLAVGTHSLYSNATNSALNSSDCSSVSVSYQRVSCPTNYIPVPFNESVGTTADFCVMKYEAKCVGTGCTGVANATTNALPESSPTGTTWVKMARDASVIACNNLNTANSVTNKYFMITNAEWMTMARDIEQVDENWSSGTKGVGVLARGHSDNSPNGPQQASSDDNDPYYLTGNSSSDLPNAGWEQKRVHTLSNGEKIWDLSGNYYDNVDFPVTPTLKAYYSGIPITPTSTQVWIDFKEIDTNAGPNDVMKPSTWQPFFSNLTGDNGIGKYWSGLNNSGGNGRRGGHWNYGVNAGIYNLRLSGATWYSAPEVTFRCVYRP